MPKHPDVGEIVRQWVRKADGDLLSASHMLILGEDCPTDTVCFHAQQCVEKCLKACLIHAGIRFPRHHDIGELMALLPSSFSFDLSPREQERLTDYATVTRYPGDYDEIPLAEARQSVEAAQRLSAKVKELLDLEP